MSQNPDHISRSPNQDSDDNSPYLSNRVPSDETSPALGGLSKLSDQEKRGRIQQAVKTISQSITEILVNLQENPERSREFLPRLHSQLEELRVLFSSPYYQVTDLFKGTRLMGELFTLVQILDIGDIAYGSTSFTQENIFSMQDCTLSTLRIVGLVSQTGKTVQNIAVPLCRDIIYNHQRRTHAIDQLLTESDNEQAFQRELACVLQSFAILQTLQSGFKDSVWYSLLSSRYIAERSHPEHETHIYLAFIHALAEHYTNYPNLETVRLLSAQLRECWTIPESAVLCRQILTETLQGFLNSPTNRTALTARLRETEQRVRRREHHGEADQVVALLEEIHRIYGTREDDEASK